jgi:hypothetical protein
MVCVGVNVSITFYASVYLPYVKKIKEDFDKYSPKAVYVGAAAMFG